MMSVRALLCLSVAAFLLIGAVQSINVPKPIKAIYIDWHLNWNHPEQSLLDSVNAGYNVIILAFYLSGGNAADMAQAWAALPAATKSATIATAHSKGAVVLLSVGGATDVPFQHDPYSLGQAAANWAKAQYLDGIDFDIENLNRGFTANGKSDTQTVDWLVQVTKGAADTLGAGGIVTHAPQAPYFGPIGNSAVWTGATGGYTSVYKQIGSKINFFLLQFYNQGPSCYTDYNGLFISSGATCPEFPYTAVKELVAQGIPLDKIVVGKPVTAADANNAWMSGATLNQHFTRAKSELGWNAGVMGWVWNDYATLQQWIGAIYPGGGSVTGGVTGSSVTGGSTATSGAPTPSPTKAPTPPPSTSGGGGCAGKADGMYCVDRTQFIWCPQVITQSCGAGTVCQQVGNSIQCGFAK